MFLPASATIARVITITKTVTTGTVLSVRSVWAKARLLTIFTCVQVTKGGAKVLRIERVEDGYMAYVGNLSRHFATLHEAVLWAEKQVYACDTKSEDR